MKIRTILETYLQESLNDLPAPVAVFMQRILTQPSAYASHIEKNAANEFHLDHEANSDRPLSYMPIEWFRSKQIVPSLKHCRSFLSSGTTSDARSCSRFSKPGLQLYRIQSLFTFYSVLQYFFEDPTEVQGISLVPSSATWPDSSLAQMVQWISEISPVQYVKEEEAVEVVTKLASHNDKPIWLFGTAFHHMNLIDAHSSHSKDQASLPAGSVIFETGGFKGKSRELNKHEFYRLLQTFWGVSNEQIISEYGMCELATQAYDFIPPSQDSSAPRRFRFPFWVRTSVLPRPGITEASGYGALVVHDPLRIDIGKPIRTEDLAQVEQDQTFELKGRFPKAPLKGCSMLAEEIIGSSTASPASTVKQSATLRILRSADPHASSTVLTRLASVQRVLNRLCHDEQSLQSLTKELGSISAAKQCLSDLIASIPTDQAQWEQALSTSIGNRFDLQRYQQHAPWLCVLPNNHSLAGIYPLSFMLILGFDVSVRIPQMFSHHGSFINLFLQLLQQQESLQPHITTVDASVKLTGQEQLNQENRPQNIFIFGNNETVAHIKSLGYNFVKGFGNKFCLSVVTKANSTSMDAFMKDAFSTGQKGCFSSRILLLQDSGMPTHNIAQMIHEAFKRFWQMPLQTSHYFSFEQEFIRYRDMHFEAVFSSADKSHNSYHHTSPEPAVFIACLNPQDLSLPQNILSRISQTISKHQFVVPVLLFREQDRLIQMLGKVGEEPIGQEIATFTTDLPLPAGSSVNEQTQNFGNIQKWRELGQLNAPKWDGRHQNESLFL